VIGRRVNLSEARPFDRPSTPQPALLCTLLQPGQAAVLRSRHLLGRLLPAQAAPLHQGKCRPASFPASWISCCCRPALRHFLHPSCSCSCFSICRLYNLLRPHLLQMDGIMSEALGIDEDAWGLWEVSGEWPHKRWQSDFPACRVLLAGAWSLRLGGAQAREPGGGAGAACSPVGLHCMAKPAPRLVPAPEYLPWCATRPLPRLIDPPASPEYPPTIYVSMVRDTPTAKKIEANRKELTRQRTPVEVIQVRSREGGVSLPLAVLGGDGWQCRSHS